MAVSVVTNDASALTDGDLDEMGSMGGAFDIGAISKAKEDWVLATDGPHRGQAARLHVLHAGAHRRHAVRADRHAERAPSLQARHGAAGPDARGVPPGADGVPRRGRRRRVAVRARPTRSTRSRSSTRSRPPPAAGRSARSGRGVAGSPSASASTARTTAETFIAHNGQSALPRLRVGQAREDRPRDRDDVRRPSTPRRATRWWCTAGRWQRISSSSASGKPAEMAEFADVVRRRRMTRSFKPDPLPEGMLEQFVDLANRAPSAGKTQGWHVVALEGEQTGPVLGHHAAADAARSVQVAGAARGAR